MHVAMEDRLVRGFAHIDNHILTIEMEARNAHFVESTFDQGTTKIARKNGKSNEGIIFFHLWSTFVAYEHYSQINTWYDHEILIILLACMLIPYTIQAQAFEYPEYEDNNEKIAVKYQGSLLSIAQSYTLFAFCYPIALY